MSANRTFEDRRLDDNREEIAEKLAALMVQITSADLLKCVYEIYQAYKTPTEEGITRFFYSLSRARIKDFQVFFEKIITEYHVFNLQNELNKLEIELNTDAASDVITFEVEETLKNKKHTKDLLDKMIPELKIILNNKQTEHLNERVNEQASEKPLDTKNSTQKALLSQIEHEKEVILNLTSLTEFLSGGHENSISRILIAKTFSNRLEGFDTQHPLTVDGSKRVIDLFIKLARTAIRNCERNIDNILKKQAELLAVIQNRQDKNKEQKQEDLVKKEKSEQTEKLKQATKPSKIDLKRFKTVTNHINNHITTHINNQYKPSYVPPPRCKINYQGNPELMALKAKLTCQPLAEETIHQVASPTIEIKGLSEPGKELSLSISTFENIENISIATSHATLFKIKTNQMPEETLHTQASSVYLPSITIRHS